MYAIFKIPSDAVSVNMSLSIVPEELAAQLRVVDGQLLINPTAKCNVIISTIDGVCIYNSSLDEDVAISLEKGIYVVTFNGKSQKVKI